MIDVLFHYRRKRDQMSIYPDRIHCPASSRSHSHGLRKRIHQSGSGKIRRPRKLRFTDKSQRKMTPEIGRKRLHSAGWRLHHLQIQCLASPA